MLASRTGNRYPAEETERRRAVLLSPADESLRDRDVILNPLLHFPARCSFLFPRVCESICRCVISLIIFMTFSF